MTEITQAMLDIANIVPPHLKKAKYTLHWMVHVVRVKLPNCRHTLDLRFTF